MPRHRARGEDGARPIPRTLLRKVVTRARQGAVGVGSEEAGRDGARSPDSPRRRRRRGDGRHGDRRLPGQLRLDGRAGGIALGQAVAVAVGVDDHVDEIGIVEGRGSAREGLVGESPTLATIAATADGRCRRGRPPVRGGRVPNGSSTGTTARPPDREAAAPWRGRCPGCCRRCRRPAPHPLGPEGGDHAGRAPAPVVAAERPRARSPARRIRASRSAPSAACSPERGVSADRNRVGPQPRSHGTITRAPPRPSRGAASSRRATS